jgi:hypothetical protein
MSISAFRRVRSKDNDLRQVQDAVGFVFLDIASKEILDGQLIKNIFINGFLSIDHKLGRELQGYVVVMQDANVVVWDSQATNTIPASKLVLNSSGPTTISIWVF